MRPRIHTHTHTHTHTNNIRHISDQVRKNSRRKTRQ
jgi:hypothetical protein